MKKIRKKLIALLTAVILLMLILPTVGEAVYADDDTDWDEISFEAQNNYKIFDIDSGLPFLGYLAVTQTPDGFIYTGGYGGLVRYDGKKFERISGIESVVSLCVTKDDGLWIGTNVGVLVNLSANDTMTYYSKEEGLDVVSVRAICTDAADNLVIGTDQGVYVMDNAGAFRLLDDDRLKQCYVNQMNSGADGVIYGSDYDGNVFVIRDLKVEYFFNVSEIGKSAQTVSEDPLREGYIYIGTTGSELLHGSLSQPIDSFEIISTPGLLNINAIVYKDDRLWLCSDGGVGFIDKNRNYTKLSDTAFNSGVAMCADYEGNLWFASSRNGLIRISTSDFADLNQMTRDLNDRVVNTTWMEDDLLYVGTDTGLLILNSKGEIVEKPVYSYLKNTRIRVIKGDSKGNLWFCTFSDYGLMCRTADGQIVTYTQNDGMLSNNIRTIYEMKDGTIAISVIGGVQLLKDGKIVQSFDESDGIPTNSILSLCEDYEGRLIMGTNGRGLYMIEGDRAVPYPIRDELDNGVIMGIKRDDRRHCFWLITGGSLGYLKDGVAKLLDYYPPELNSNGCYDVLWTDSDTVFLMCNTGILLMDGDDLLAGTVEEYEHYNSKKGLPHMVTPNSRSCVMENGDAYVACSDGLVRMNLINIQSSGVTPILAIPFVETDTDEKPQRVTDGQTITVPASTRRLSIYPYVLSYGLNDPKVSYYLEGFDRDPMISSKEDLGQVSYTNLRGGTYVFHLDLLDGSEGERSVSVTIVKQKAFYEKPAFWAAMAVAALALIIWIVNQLLRRQAEALKRKAAEAERQKEEERIGRELNMAASIQAGALPRIFPAFPDRKEFDIFASMTPAKEVGGDFYDFFMVDDNHLGMVIADVSDKGVPAALYMMSAKMIISSYAKMGKSPKDVLEAANNDLTADYGEEMFVTVWLGILDLRTGLLTAANAGHEYPILRRPDGEFEIVKDQHGLVLGGMPGVRYKEYELQLSPGAKLFVYTDGVPEACNEAKDFFGLERTVSTLNQVVTETPQRILETVKDAVYQFVAGAPRFDDLTMMCLQYNGISDSKNSIEEKPGL
ncbi:MAG: SpoIIE family protein phosphatase [Erysipelotrichaceae bacterium]|nr:SpoIIE family protein phosphatase [Erysipelotrichaceae bacterium]